MTEANLSAELGLRGWWAPGNARKFHIADANGRSLCGNWASWGTPRDAFTPVTSTVAVVGQDCERCLAKVRKMIAKKEGRS